MQQTVIMSSSCSTFRLACLCIFLFTADAFTSSSAGKSSSLDRVVTSSRSSTVCLSSSSSAPPTEYKGFGLVEEKEEEKDDRKADDDDVMKLSVLQIKDKLLDLVPRMMGTSEELRAVESYVNALEAKYMPAQTLDFLNLAMGGEWQLLFSTNRLGPPKPQFRLREMYQKVETKGLEGSITNQVQWELDQTQDMSFDVTGTFSVKCNYKINQGARMVVELDDHVLNLLPGSKVPKDVPALVGMLHRAMPTEMFDPNEHAMDTTYMDGDLRIVRMTGPQHEGVRDIFIRRGSIELNPSS